MSKNNYLTQRAERDRRFFEAGMRTGAQFVTDYMAIALHNPDVMGKTRILSGDSIKKIFGYCGELDVHFSRAFSEHAEADYSRYELDGALREVFGDETIPFEQRYPFSKDFNYLKPKKGWVD